MTADEASRLYNSGQGIQHPKAPDACPACGQMLGHDGWWPLSDGTLACHECFSTEADREWWIMVESFRGSECGYRDAEKREEEQ